MNIWKAKQKLRRLFSSKDMPTHNIVILCNPRSGSTWLLDALRCHPTIDMFSGAGFYNRFQLDGKRYPGDMSVSAENGKTIEVLPMVKQRIPVFNIPATDQHFPFYTSYGIEKIHPEFYDFKTETFIKQLKKATTEGHQFKFILLMRHPLSAMQSFYQYQQRNPNWYAWMDEDELVAYTLRTFKSMALFQQKLGGQVINYAHFLKAPQEVLKKIYTHIWNDLSPTQQALFETDIQQSIALTQRKKRATSHTSFLGKKTGKVHIQMEDLPFYKEKYRADMLEMVRLFDNML